MILDKASCTVISLHCFYSSEKSESTYSRFSSCIQILILWQPEQIKMILERQIKNY